jgi:Sjoegren syndrome nuclear autoantigen 1
VRALLAAPALPCSRAHPLALARLAAAAPPATMASQGSSLQNYNNELVACIDVRRRRASTPVRARARSLTTVPPARCLPALASQDLRSKREEVNRSILRDEEEKAKIQKELTTMTERLSRINEDLARKMQARNEFDQTIQETEAAYMKILESSQTLLNVLKREAINLQKKRGASS